MDHRIGSTVDIPAHIRTTWGSPYANRLRRQATNYCGQRPSGQAFAGRRPTSFAYPCGQRFVGRGKATRSYVPLVAERFLVGRGFLDETPNDPLRCDMAQVSGVAADGKDFEQLRDAIDSVLEEGRWLVLVAHDVASELEPQAMTTDVLEEVCHHVSRLPELWTDTVSAIGSHLLQKRGG